MENCVAHLKSVGTYGDAEAEAMQKFAEAFKPINFPPGASVFYRQSPDGILGVSNTANSFCFLTILIEVYFYLVNEERKLSLPLILVY